MSDLPIACTLDAPDYSKRLARMAAVGGRSLISSDKRRRAVVLTFRPDPDTRNEVEQIVAAESECCSFLAMSISESDQTLALTIEAPEDAEPILGELVHAFAGTPRGLAP